MAAMQSKGLVSPMAALISVPASVSAKVVFGAC